MTISEDAFEQLCREQGITFLRIEEGEQRRPDYTIRLSGNEVVVEIKQFDPSNEEEQLYKRFLDGESVVVDMSPPGRKMRKAIDSGYPQLAALAKGKLPALLVVYNNVPIGDHTDPYAIKAAMFGLETIDIAVPKDFSRSPYPVDRRFGGKRRITHNQCRSLSAIGRLVHREDRSTLQVFDPKPKN